MALHKVFNPSKNNLRIKIIVKRTEDILVERFAYSKIVEKAQRLSSGKEKL